MWQTSKAGRLNELVVFKHGQTGPIPVGVLRFEGSGHMRPSTFTYARSWLARSDRVSIAPGILVLRRGAFNGMPYEAPIPFYDAAPDGWGKAILRAAFPAQDFGLAEFLAASGNDRTGDLAFGHSADEPPTRWLPSAVPMLRLPNAEDTIEDLLEASEAVEGGEPKPHHLHLLFWHSADQGGARPKATVFLGDRPYMAKFPALGDPFDDPRVEGVCLTLGPAEE